MPAGLQFARGDVALTLNAQAAGTVTSGPFANSGEAGVVMASLHLTAITGTTPTATLTIEESANGTSGWTAVVGGAGPSQTAAGSACVMVVPSKSFVRASVAVTGTGASVTGSVPVIVFGD
jgi:hypothetical protein